MFTNLKPLLLPALAGLCLSIVSFFIWLQVNGPAQNQDIVFGQVVDVASSTLTIESKNGDQTIVTLASTTEFARKREDVMLTDVTAGSFVQVTGQTDAGTFVAQSVRLLRHPGGEPNRDDR